MNRVAEAFPKALERRAFLGAASAAPLACRTGGERPRRLGALERLGEDL